MIEKTNENLGQQENYYTQKSNKIIKSTLKISKST